MAGALEPWAIGFAKVVEVVQQRIELVERAATGIARRKRIGILIRGEGIGRKSTEEFDEGELDFAFAIM